jgi:hypothetical protein
MQDICDIINDNLNSIFPDAHMPLSRAHVPAAQTTTALWEGAEPPRQYEGRIVTASVELRPADAATGVFTFGAAATMERHTVGNFTLLVRAADKVAAAQRVAAALRSDRAKLHQYMDDAVGGGAVFENGGSESALPQTAAAAGAERGGGGGKRGRGGGKAAAGPRGE